MFRKNGCRRHAEWEGQDLLLFLSCGPLFVVARAYPRLPIMRDDPSDDRGEVDAPLPLIWIANIFRQRGKYRAAQRLQSPSLKNEVPW